MKPPRHLLKVTLHSPLIPWQYSESEMEDACLVRLSAYDVLRLLVVISTHRHSYLLDWIHVRYLSGGTTSFPFSSLHNVAHTYIRIYIPWNVFLEGPGSSCGVFFPFHVILEVLSSFLSPGPCLTAPSPCPSKVLAAWRIVWTCIDPMWDYSWVIGELDELSVIRAD